MKYIVTWIIVKMLLVDCPPSVPIIDEFGREKPKRYYETMEGCYKYDTTHKEKYFDIRKDAIDFIARGQDKKADGINPIMYAGELSGFKLDSIPLVQYNCQHLQFSSTLIICPGEPCNTATCLNCGKKWATF